MPVTRQAVKWILKWVDYERRFLSGDVFGRGFDSRRLHICMVETDKHVWKTLLNQRFFILVKERKVEKYKIFCIDFAFKKTFKHLEIPNTYSGKSILRFTKRTFVRTLFLRWTFMLMEGKTQLWFKHVPSNKFFNYKL